MGSGEVGGIEGGGGWTCDIRMASIRSISNYLFVVILANVGMIYILTFDRLPPIWHRSYRLPLHLQS